MTIKKRRDRYERAEKEFLSKLKRIVKSGHTLGCALGSVPACTCGVREAKGALKFFERK